MVSLSTIYGVTIVLGSLAAMGSAYVGTKVYPIQTGGDPLAGATALAATVTGAFAAAEKALTPAPEPLATETVKEEGGSITFEPTYDNKKLPVYNPKSNEHDKIVYIESLPPTSFFLKQMKFINSLSEEEKLILKSYSWLGDNIINYYVRSKQNGTPVSNSELLSRFSEMKDEYSPKIMRQLMGVNSVDEVSEENIESTLLTYIINFHKTFNKAPITEEEIRVFRGTKTEITKHNGYISTTYNPFSSSLFKAFTGETCCLYELIIPPGTTVILLDLVSDLEGESEILIGPGSTITTSKKTTKELWEITTNSEPDNKKSITVFEGIVQPAVLPKVEEPVQTVEEAVPEVSGPPASGGKRRLPPWFKH